MGTSAAPQVEHDQRIMGSPPFQHQPHTPIVLPHNAPPGLMSTNFQGFHII
ncbi:hypothetical protein PAXRUDRAFT_21006 [Paxillus rubicundulus Ve08.2h10]|uniref:Uncharacterized protein n=1 Tax=Paxillus rubicundulus Ve08.2h10 TaxID=930991 RepID=A0A0D0D0E4_9AGAM|nr:hypothetical protein PAXRUDRAFT_21006 [Paxillus rubicundulus Ve08.2h10]